MERKKKIFLIKNKLMIKLLFLISFAFISFGFFSQSFSVDDNLVNIEGDATTQSIANNTFLNASSSDALQWTIIDASIPQEWEFSNCFPNCYNIGVTSGSLEIMEGESYYLNCHVYPNNTPGEGSITMQITSNDGTTALVTWQAIAGSASLIENALSQKEIKGYYSREGKKLSEPLKGSIMFVVFLDGTSQQIFISE